MATQLDWQEMERVSAQADWRWMAPAVAATAASYLVSAYSYAIINRLFGIPLPVRDLLEIGLVSGAMIASVGGVAGHSVRLLLLDRRGLPPSQVMAPSLFHGYIESLLLFVLIPGGLAYLLLTHPLEPLVAATVLAGTVVLGAAFGVTAVVFFYGPARSKTLAVFGWGWRLVARADITQGLAAFDATLAAGLTRLRERPVSTVAPIVLLLFDRVLRLAVLWVCLEALGIEVEAAVVVTGFAIGVSLGVMSLAPGGLGLQEGTMAGTYHLLGMPLEEAVVVALLFRSVYHLLPLGLTASLYWRVLRQRPQMERA